MMPSPPVVVPRRRSAQSRWRRLARVRRRRFALLDRYYDDEWGTFGEDGWRFVRDLRTALGDTDLTMRHPVCEVCWLTHPEGACDR